MSADVFCLMRADQLMREVAARRARAPEPGIEPRVMPTEIENRGLLEAVFGQVVR